MENKPDEWRWDKLAELQKAKKVNHFTREGLEELVSMRDKTPENIKKHLERFSTLLYVCEAFDIKVAGLRVSGSSPLVLVDVRPSVRDGYPKKYGEIIEHNFEGYKVKRPLEIIADFDITVWGAEATRTPDGEWKIKLDKIPVIP